MEDRGFWEQFEQKKNFHASAVLKSYLNIYETSIERGLDDVDIKSIQEKGLAAMAN
jgi:hypothetical protein